MKFRRLTAEELGEMEQEFIHYLIANGIDAPEWEKIKSAGGDEAEQWILGFSDMVLQKVLEGVNYLEFRSEYEARFFECGSEEMNLIAMISRDIDLNDTEQLEAATKNPGKIELFKGNKKYSGNREEELFAMTQSGCEISDGKMFLLLKQMV